MAVLASQAWRSRALLLRRIDDRPVVLRPARRAAEEAGYDSMVVPDSICYPRHSDSTYPFNPDGSREFLEDKPFLEPFSLIPALGALTSRLRFVTFVLKLPVRHPLLVAKQATSTAVLTGNRLVLGVGTSPWREDYELTGVPWERRGQRLDEEIAIIRGLSAGGYFEYPRGDLRPAAGQDRAGAGRADPGPARRARRRRPPPGRPQRGRLAARRGRPGAAARAAGQAGPAAPGGGHRGQAVRDPRDLRGRVHRGRGAAAGGSGGDRRHRRLPLALRDRSRHRAPRRQARPSAPLRRRRYRQGAAADAGGHDRGHQEPPGPKWRQIIPAHLYNRFHWPATLCTTFRLWI